LNNCTIVSNSASASFGEGGGGSVISALNNCIIYYNTAPVDPDSYIDSLSYCCTPAAGYGGNFTNAPRFLNLATGDLRLQTNSPCINAGNNLYTNGLVDLSGNPRVAGGTVDVGAYEFQTPTSVISYAWLQQYGLSISGSADYTDPDGDQMSNWQEWRTDTNPTNALSVLRVLTVTNDPSGWTVVWQSVDTRNYFIERSSNLLAQPPFQILATDIPGQAGTSTHSDVGVTNAGSVFYRVGVP